MSRLLIGRKSLTLASRPEHHRLVEGEGRLDVGEHHRGRSIGYRGAVGTLEGARDDRVLVGDPAAEVVAQVLADLRPRVRAAVPVVLGRDAGERVALVAVLLVVALRDGREDAREAAFDLSILLAVARAEQDVAHLRPRRVGHLLDADHEHDAPAFRFDEVETLVNGGRAGRAGVLDPGGGFEAQAVVRLEHERRGEVLRGEPVVEETDVDGVHVIRRDARVRHRLGGDPGDERLDVLAFEPAELRMRPACDATRHVLLPCRVSGQGVRAARDPGSDPNRTKDVSHHASRVPATRGSVPWRARPGDDAPPRTPRRQSTPV